MQCINLTRSYCDIFPYSFTPFHTDEGSVGGSGARAMGVVSPVEEREGGPDDIHAAQAKRKLYFNPAYFEPEMLQVRSFSLFYYCCYSFFVFVSFSFLLPLSFDFRLFSCFFVFSSILFLVFFFFSLLFIPFKSYSLSAFIFILHFFFFYILLFSFFLLRIRPFISFVSYCWFSFFLYQTSEILLIILNKNFVFR